MPLYKGNTKIGAIYKGTTPISAIYKGSTLIFSSYTWQEWYVEYVYNTLVPTQVNKTIGLPKEYQEVEYLESHGTEYIDTGYNFPSTGDIDLECKFMYVGQQRSKSFFGCQKNPNISPLLWLNGSYKLQLYLAKTYGMGYDIPFNFDEVNDCKIKTNGSNYTFNFNSFSQSGTFEQGWCVDYSFVLFGNNFDGRVTQLTDAKLYKFKLSVAGKPVLNLIPCYRKSDNVAGLYDLVNGVFYTNQGTGTFLKGNDVNRNVLDKAKVSTIYGNSVVENQLVQMSTNYPTQVKINDNAYSLEVLANADTYAQIPLTFIDGHKYLIRNAKSGTFTRLVWWQNGYTSSINFNSSSYPSEQIITQSGSKTFGVLNLQGDVGSKFILNITDLTQRYPFNTPTTLTDIRVQALLNRGYISYNTGTLKNVDMSEVSSEPYNLFVGNSETSPQYIGNYYIDNSSNYTVSANNNFNGFRIKVIQNTSYTFESNQSTLSTECIFRFVDSNYNFISGNATGYNLSSKTITTPNGCEYIEFSINKTSTKLFCLHLTGTRTGYAPYIAPQTLSLKYQGSGVNTSHDTMVIGKDNVVFTKNISRYTFTGSETWNYYADGDVFYGTIVQKAFGYRNVISEKYPTRTSTNGNWNLEDGTIGGAINGYPIYIKDSSLNGNTNDLKTKLGTSKLEYELATPQVITIPRKHIGVAKIRDLGGSGWARGTYVFYSPMGVINNANNGNNYCSVFEYSTLSNANKPDLSFEITSSGSVNIKVNNITSVSDFLDQYGDYYIYYETTDESTIPNIIGVQGGGTITTNWFSWVKNQLVRSGNFGSDWANYWSTGHSISVSNNIATFTANAQYGGPSQTLNLNAISGHKYFVSAYVKTTGGNMRLRYIAGSQSESVRTDSEAMSFVGEIVTANNNSQITVQVADFKSTPTQAQMTNVMLIDLTQAFGSGNEPITTSDTRIQYILSQGYIPTDTTGTSTNVPTQVLPNIEFELKAK